MVILDESDEHSFNNPLAFMKFTRKTPCICLTATYAESYSGGIERNVLKKMDFRIFENLFEWPKEEATIPHFQKMGKMPDGKICDFLKDLTQNQAVLLYCGSDFKDWLLTQLDFATFIDEDVSHTMLRNLDQSVNGRYSLLITDEAARGLRGLDLKGHDSGLVLISLKSFSHHREMLQAAYRVGRCGEKCKRLLIGDIDLVNHLASCKYKKKLVKFIDGAQEKPLPKR